VNDGLPPRWREASETLSTLLTWLEETGQWVETTAADAPQTASVTPAPLAVADAAARPASGTTAAAVGAEGRLEEEDAVSPDLFTLLAALTALRQEVKLQTRSARHDREQTAQALEHVTHTVAQVDTLRQVELHRYEAAVQEAERAMAEALVDVHDAFSRATREADRIVASVVTELRQWSAWLRPAQESVTETPLRQGVLSRLWARFGRPPRPVNAPTTAPLVDTGRGDAATVLHQCRSAAGPMADRLEGLAEGYQLSLQRLERLLATYGIEPIACLGQPVDATLMEVVQVVADSSQPSGMVLDEVRRGYRRLGQVWRFAQVVATRAVPPADGMPPAAALERQEETPWK